MRAVVILCLKVVGCSAKAARQSRKFPDDFIFGAATAAYQVEGGWNADGKGESIWDHLTHNYPEAVADFSNGDISADSYNNYKRDVEMMRELGLDAYRFSVAWPRILPDGFSNNVNEAGIQFYNNYIDEMLKYNIQPLITLYHWDLPQKLQELGGFENPYIVDWFTDYARIVFERFGDRVKTFITFNEPREVCYGGYGSVSLAPRLNATGVGAYLCAKHIVLAHAKAYHLYNNEFKPSQGGECGITININWYGPATDTEEDNFAAEIRRQGQWGLYAEPIFSEEGGFPKEYVERVAQKSAEQGFAWSRLPSFTEEERLLVRGSHDFFGVNHYSSYFVSATEGKTVNPVPSVLDDIDLGSFQPDEWPKAASSWLALAPNSLFNTISFLSDKYKNVTKFYITENGWSSLESEGLNDEVRIAYYRSALENVLDVIDAGINLKGYMAWSLMDNFEWLRGMIERFGLYHVDFEDPARTRTPKKSAFIYKNIITNRYIDHDYEPESMTMTIDN